VDGGRVHHQPDFDWKPYSSQDITGSVGSGVDVMAPSNKASNKDLPHHHHHRPAGTTPQRQENNNTNNNINPVLPVVDNNNNSNNNKKKNQSSTVVHFSNDHDDLMMGGGGGSEDRGMLRAQNSELRTLCSELKLELEAQVHETAKCEKRSKDKLNELKQLIQDAESRAQLGHDTSIALDNELQRVTRLLEEEKQRSSSLREQLQQDHAEKLQVEERRRQSMVEAISTMVTSLKVESPQQVVESIATLIAVELNALRKEQSASLTLASSFSAVYGGEEKGVEDWAVEASLRVSCKLLNAVSLSKSTPFPKLDNDLSDWSDKLRCGSLGDLATKVRTGIGSLPKLHSLEHDLSSCQAQLDELNLKIERANSRLSALHASCEDTSKRCKALALQEERLKVGMETSTAKFEEVDMLSKEAERRHHEEMIRAKSELFQLKEAISVQEKRRLACEEASGRAKQALQDLFDRCERAKKEVVETEGKLSSERAELESLRSSSELTLAEVRSAVATATGERRFFDRTVKIVHMCSFSILVLSTYAFVCKNVS
jgi:chromosome segregation ATPase